MDTAVKELICVIELTHVIKTELEVFAENVRMDFLKLYSQQTVFQMTHVWVP